ncbi:MAG: hypothetical protein U1E65_05205 [Myxococcota bacterium]
MRLGLIFSAFLVMALPAFADEAPSVTGTVREVSELGHSVGELKAEDGETLRLRGKTPADEAELASLSGLKVKFFGARSKGLLSVERFEVLEAGGQRPRIGVIASLSLSGEARLLFVDVDGHAELLPTGFTAKGNALVGAKVWMIGLKKGERFTPLRFGVLRANPTNLEENAP